MATRYGSADAAEYVTQKQQAQPYLQQAGNLPATNANIDTVMRALRASSSMANTAAPKLPVQPKTKVTSSGGGGGRGGGGGGGAVAPTMSQEMLNWAAQLLGAGRPKPYAAGNLDLPDWQGMGVRAFDPSGFDAMRQQWAQATGSDRAAAQQAYGQLNDYLTGSYRNAFQTNAPNTQAPGMSQDAMSRMLQSQGVNPAINAANAQGQAAGNAAFQNLWGLLGANEDTAQGNRLRRSQIDQNNTMRLLDLASQSGLMQLNQSQAQALAAWQQRADERAYQDYAQQQQVLQQEAMQNWQRANQVQDTNATNTNAYTNATLQALFGLFPELIKSPGLTMPDMAALGLGA